MSSRRRLRRLTAIGVIGAVLAGCNSTTGPIVGGTIGATVLGAMSPTQEIEQIYYLGVFDPQDQLPEAVYRLTVKGQASFISFMSFASGWLPASIIDSLGGDVTMRTQEGNRGLSITGPDAATKVDLQTGRRLVLFGPEGFREAPRNHRLVIVMGASPERFFKAIDTALGEIAQMQVERDNSGVQKEIFQALLNLKTDQQAFKEVELDVAKEFK